MASQPGPATGGSPLSIRKFDGRNFMIWKSQIIAYMRIKECFDAVVTDRPQENLIIGTKDEKQKRIQEWEDKNNVALGILLLSLCDEQAVLICHLTSARLAWERLLQAYEHKGQGSRVALQMQFNSCNMRSGEKVVEYIGRMQRIYTQLLQSGAMIDEESLVGRIVGGLTSEYHVFMTNWSNNVGLRQTMSELVPRLSAEELLVQRVRRSDPHAMVAEGRSGNGSKKSNKWKQGNGNKNEQRRQEQAPRTDVQGQSRFAGKRNGQRICYNCQRPGHLARFCKNGRQEPQLTNVEQETSRQEETIEAEGIVAEANLAVRYEPLDEASDVKMGDKGRAKCVGKGDVSLRAVVEGEERILVLKDVLHVPSIRRKLISLGAATSKGKIGQILLDRVVLKNQSGETILVAVKEHNLYRALVTEGGNEQQEATLCAAEKADSDMELWHERLAHVNRETIARMKKLNVVVGLESCDLSRSPRSSDRRVIQCDSCCLAKQSRLPFPSSSRKRASEVGQYVHMDICGPIGTTSLSGAKYFILFKDEFSAYRIINFMKSREEAYDCIRKVVAKIKSEAGKEVHCFVSDLGSEFTSNRTQKYLLDSSIEHKTSAAFTPEQNGFVERENRTIMEAARAMLFHNKLPEILWAESANAAVYILNRVLNKNSDETPYQRYFGRKPQISHLRVFGCVAFVKLPEKKRSGYQRKLDPRSQQVILVGYDEHRVNTYRLYDKESKKILISREVRFDEGREPDILEGDNYEALDELLSETPEAQATDDEEFDEMEANFVSNELADEDEPSSYAQALASPHARQWREAMDDEYRSLLKNRTWASLPLPPHRRAVSCKWVYKIKRNTDGSVARFKARLVARGFTQRAGVDYNETFAPVVRLESIRVVLSLIARLDLEVVHFDVRTAFLHGELSEEIWMREPEGYQTGNACKLIKALYGLKQASRAWNSCFVSFLKEFNLKPVHADSCVLVNERQGGELLLVAIWVDDGLACSTSKILLNKMVTHLQQRFEITLMEPQCFVGLEIKRDRVNKLLTVTQSAYVRKLIERFGLAESAPRTVPMSPTIKFCREGAVGGGVDKISRDPYRQIIGSLMYLAVGSRPDISYAVAVLARFCQEPKNVHYEAAKDVVRYLKASISLGLSYDGKLADPPVVFVDADFASCTDTRRSLTGLVIKCSGAPVVWRSQKQSTVSESTCEAEFTACSLASREACWLRQLLSELGVKMSEPTQIMCDNQSAIRLVKNNQIHSKIKHLDVRLFAIREREEKKQVDVVYVPTQEQQADILTKALPKEKFKYLRAKMGMIMLCLLLLISSSEAIKFKVGNDWANQAPMRRIGLKINDPCPTAINAEEKLRGPIELKGEIRLNVSAIGMTKTMCKTIMDEKVTMAIYDLTGCLVKRNKRDLGAIASLASSAATIIVGVTNLIRGSSEETTSANRKDIVKALGEQVDANTMSTLQDRNTMVEEESRELAIVSDAAASHLDLVREEVNNVPMLVWAAYHVVHELYAGLADLRSIKKQCSRGRLATVELGELLENEELRALDPEDTRLVSVSVNLQERQIEFTYQPEKFVEIKPEQLGYIIFGFVMFFLVLTMVIMNVEVMRSVSGRRAASGHQVAARTTLALEI